MQNAHWSTYAIIFRSRNKDYILLKVSDVQIGNFFMSGKVLKTIYFLKGYNADNSNLILVGLKNKGE